MRRLFRFLLILSLLAATRSFVHAQTAAYAEIARIDAAAFPKVAALLDVYDANGEFIAGIKPSDITVFEDGQETEADSVRESEVPIQLVVAVNPGPPLAIRDSNGIARFERVVETLSSWVGSQAEDSRDDLSLVSLSGSLINHARVDDWFVSLNSFKPDFRNSVPNLQTLSIALDTVNASTPEPGMKRAVLFITPRMEDPNIDNTVAPLIQRAIDAKVRVFVWFMDAEEFHVSPSANAFRMLAQQTDGAFFAFSRSETFPDLNEYFAPLRHVYEVTYTSSLTTSGEHTLGFYITRRIRPSPRWTRPSASTSSRPTRSSSRRPADHAPAARGRPLQQGSAGTFTAGDRDHRRVPGRSQARTQTHLPVRGRSGRRREHRNPSTASSGITAPSPKADSTRSSWRRRIARADQIEHRDPVTFTFIHAPSGVEAILARYSSQLVMGAIIFAWACPAPHPGAEPREEHAGIAPPQGPQGKRGPAHPARPGIDGAARFGYKEGKSQPRFNWMGSWKSRVPSAPAYLIRLTNGGEPASAAPIPVLEKDMTFGTDPVQSCMCSMTRPFHRCTPASNRRTKEFSLFGSWFGGGHLGELRTGHARRRPLEARRQDPLWADAIPLRPEPASGRVRTEGHPSTINHI
jgi:hypothetical protein